jgi:hypothetical protein
MPEPITIGIIAFFKWMAAHTAIHGATAAGAHGVAAAGTHAAGAHVLGAHAAGTGLAAGTAGFHLTPAVVLGTTVAASTVGGITFVNIYNNLLNDLYSQAKRGLRGAPSLAERRQILDSAYRAARAELVRRGILTPVNQAEMSRIYRAVAA